MQEFLAQYKNNNEDRFNLKLINRELDDNLVDLIIDSCRSLEVLEYVKYLGHTLITDETQIDQNQFITTRKTTRKKSDVRYMYMQDSRLQELRLQFKLKCKGKDGNMEEMILTKQILIPVPDEDGYYTIKGKKYMFLYQLVDSSTYTSRQNLTLKSFRPIVLRRNKNERTDTDGNSYAAPAYALLLFKKEIDILLFYFAKMGVSETLKFFDVHNTIRFVESERDKEKNIYFKVKSKIYLEVNRNFFNKYQYVQSMTFMILNLVTNRINMEDMDDTRHWIELLGSLNTATQYNYYEKGMSSMTSFTRMLDETTKSILRVNGINKKSMFSVVRWIIQNYNELRKKDNMDLANKRLRCNEYIASLFTKWLSERVDRVISQGNKVTIDKVREIFKFNGNVLIEQLHMSGLLRYDDRVNDMNFFERIRFTLKGPNSLGGKNDNKLSMKYRGIHPSHIGRLDINVCGTSDPGSSGIIVPFCKTDGLYFDASSEPQDGIYDMQREYMEQYVADNQDRLVINLYAKCETIEDYHAMTDKFDALLSTMQVMRRSRRDTYRIWINESRNPIDDL